MMRKRVTISLIAMVITALFIVAASSVTTAPQATVSGFASCDTDAFGYCQITYNFGKIPTSVQVEMRSPINGSSKLPYQHAVDAITANSFRVRWLTQTGTLYAKATVKFGWTAFDVVLADVSPTTPAPTTTTPAPTTVPPTTVPPTTVPPTTAPAGLCAPVPSACGYPDASNTGVPSGTALTVVKPGDSGPGWHYDSRGWVTIDGQGAVFDRKSLNVDIDVVANNVTISNSQIRGGGFGWPIALRHTTGVKILSNSIGGTDKTTNRCDNAIRGIYGDDDSVTIMGNDISYCASAVNHLDRGGRIADNYMHDFGLAGQDHVNGIQLGSGSGPLMTIEHNTIFNEYSQTDCIMLANDDGSQTNRDIKNNLLAGGGYTFYGSGGPAGIATNIKFTSNRFSKKFYPNSGYYGPVAYWKPSGSGNVWSGNIWDEDRSSVNP